MLRGDETRNVWVSGVFRIVIGGGEGLGVDHLAPAFGPNKAMKDRLVEPNLSPLLRGVCSAARRDHRLVNTPGFSARSPGTGQIRFEGVAVRVKSLRHRIKFFSTMPHCRFQIRDEVLMHTSIPVLLRTKGCLLLSPLSPDPSVSQ